MAKYQCKDITTERMKTSFMVYYLRSKVCQEIVYHMHSVRGFRTRSGVGVGWGWGIVDFVQFREFPLKINDLRHPLTSPLTQFPKFPKISNRPPIPERSKLYKTP